MQNSPTEFRTVGRTERECVEYQVQMQVTDNMNVKVLWEAV